MAGMIILDQDEDNRAQILSAIDSKQWDYLGAVAREIYNIPPALLFGHIETFPQALDCIARDCPKLARRDLECFLHLRYYESTPKYLTALRLIPFVQQYGGSPLVEIASGFGHLSQLFRRTSNAKTVYLLDLQPLNLLVSSWIVENDSRNPTCRVAVDFRDGLPLASNSMGLAVISDALHEMYFKRFVLRESGRALRDDGGFLALHLHNANRLDEPFQQYSHTVAQWHSLLEDALRGRVAIYSDDAVLDSWRNPSEIRFSAIPTDNPRSFIATKPADAVVQSLHTDGWDGGNLVINPIYEADEVGDFTRLRCRRMSALYQLEHRPDVFFPDRIIPRLPVLSGAERRALFNEGVLVHAKLSR